MRRCLLFVLPLLLVPGAPAPAQVTAIGLSTVRAQRFENEDLLFYEPEPGDRFAWSLAVGDFNGDGADDLATGMPFDDGFAGGGGPVDCGAVVVRHGIPGSGLATGVAFNFLSQTASGSADPADEDDLFGYALAACDFNNDGFDDLAIGIPHEDHGGVEHAGAIQIHYGSSTGLSAAGLAFHTESTPGMPGDLEAEDRFGWSLACGDFDGDGFADLAVGVPHESIEDSSNAGMIVGIPGSAGGLDPQSASSLDQDSSGMQNVSRAADLFGWTLASADFDGDGFDDLAIGVPGENFGFLSGAGAVHLVFGGASGLSAGRNLLFFEDALGGTPEIDDQFGYALTAGDFDGDGFDDLAIGVPFEDLGGVVDTGNVGEVFGSGVSPHIDFGRSQGWDQNRVLGLGTTETTDLFGYALVAADFDRDGYDDLAAGHPGEFFVGQTDGAVTVWMGSAAGLTADRHRGIFAGFEGFPGDAGQHAKAFGHSLTAGDFDGDGQADLAIGAPLEDDNGLADVGTETVLYGALCADGFETGDAGLWTSVAP